MFSGVEFRDLVADRCASTLSFSVARGSGIFLLLSTVSVKEPELNLPAEVGAVSNEPEIDSGDVRAVSNDSAPDTESARLGEGLCKIRFFLRMVPEGR